MKHIFKIERLAAALVLAATLTALLPSCDRLVFEEEGVCVVNYRLRFVYDMNLKWADAFPSEVHSVHLYAFDRNGVFVKEFTANGADVDSEDYRMQLELEPGHYSLVAWCGMEDEGISEKSFTVPVPVAGQTRIEEVTSSLNVKSDSESAHYSDTMLRFLYHGIMDVDLPQVFHGDYEYTMHLTKNTNHIRIVLQQLSAEDLIPEEFEFRIEEANGVMGHDNSMQSTDVINYRPWNVWSAEAGMVTDDTRSRVELEYADALIADLSTSRLMADHKEDMMLTITTKDKVTGNVKVVAQVPLLQYALMSKEYYEMAYGHKMTEQEFLDREDEYLFTFFLDDTQRWTEMHIRILSYRLVIHNYEM